MSSVYAVVLAGGSGKRLWPLSRHHIPKQLIPFGSSTLFELALQRLQDVPFITDYAVTTTAEYAQEIHSKSTNSLKIFGEPCSKNTAPAILYSCLQIMQADPEAQVIFVPADHVIGNNQQYAKAISLALSYTHTYPEKLALIGVRPTHAATGYGYISRSLRPVDGQQDVFAVTKFHEKPSRDRAHIYSNQVDMLWNCGIFCGSVNVFVELFKKYAPELYQHVTCGDYYAVDPISFDKAILEKIDESVVVQGDFAWADVGTLELFIDHAQQLRNFGNSQAQSMLLESRNVHVYNTEKLVVLYGVENMCVVETEDTIVVVNTEFTASMDRVVDALHKKGYEQYL